MSNNDEKTLKKFWEIIVGAGKFATRDELVSHIETNAEAIDEGSLATMRLLAAGSIHMENAFTVLDSAKAIATKNLIFRAAATRAGKHYDMILNRLDPGHVSFYLKSKPHPTAIVSFHFIGRDRLSILLAANTPTESGIRGFGDVYYDCIWLDGIQHITGSVK